MKTKEIKIEVPSGYEIDKEKSTYEKIVFKKKEFEHFEFNGVYVDTDSTLVKVSVYSEVLNANDKNIWISEAHAKASLAISLLSVYMASPTYNGDWVADWEDGHHLKFQIYFVDNEMEVTDSYYRSCFLSFKSKDVRNRFLENYRELILEAKLLL